MVTKLDTGHFDLVDDAMSMFVKVVEEETADIGDLDRSRGDLVLRLVMSTLLEWTGTVTEQGLPAAVLFPCTEILVAVLDLGEFIESDSLPRDYSHCRGSI